VTEQEEPSSLNKLLSDEAWLRKFCTNKQLRSILHQMESQGDPPPIKLVIESDTEQNFVTVESPTGSKYTF
jgi:hypothetical protein